MAAEDNLSDGEKKTIMIHGLYSHKTLKESFRLVGLKPEDSSYVYDLRAQYATHLTAVTRLGRLGFLQGSELTSKGWELLCRLLEPSTLKLACEEWAKDLKIAQSETDKAIAERERWAVLRQFLTELRSEPKQNYQLDAPTEINDVCRGFLKNARLCICVGAWAGATNYCSLAMEYLFASALINKGKLRRFDQLAMERLFELIGKEMPDVGSLTKRLMGLITNFRNDSVHPRDQTLLPGEEQARFVYDLTCRLMNEVRSSWFETRADSR